MSNNAVFDDLSDAIRKHLDREGITDLCVNRPGEIHTRTSDGWTTEPEPAITERWCRSFIQVCSNEASQSTNKASPILSTRLLTGERIQVVLPPAASAVSISIRIPQKVLIPIESYEKQGLLLKGRRASLIENTDVKKAKLIYDENPSVLTALQYCIQSKLNIIFSGATGSGKTTIANTISAFIPLGERIITIEDADEMMFPHKNIVSLYYPRDVENPYATPKQLLASTMRMSPDRIIFGELRGSEAYFYLDKINTGHRGSITTIHANSGKKALKRLVKLIKLSPEGRGFTNDEILQDCRDEIDVIFQWNSRGIDHGYFPSLEE